MDAREKYLSALKKYLVPLAAEEKDDALDFYGEYITDAGYQKYDEITAELGTPRQLSRKILADYSIRENDQENKSGHAASAHSSWRVFWLVVLAIITSPITFALSLGALLVLVIALAVVFGITVGLLGIILGLFVAACATVYTGFGLILAVPMTGIFYIGAGLSILGVLLICIPLSYWVIRWLAQVVANLSKWIYQKIDQRREKNHEKNV